VSLVIFVQICVTAVCIPLDCTVISRTLNILLSSHCKAVLLKQNHDLRLSDLILFQELRMFLPVRIICWLCITVGGDNQSFTTTRMFCWEEKSLCLLWRQKVWPLIHTWPSYILHKCHYIIVYDKHCRCLFGQETHCLDTRGNKISNRKEIDNNNFCVYLVAILIDKYDNAGSLAIEAWNLLHTVSPSDLGLFFGHTVLFLQFR